MFALVAATYFNFSIPNLTVSTKDTLDIEMQYELQNISEEDFKIRPMISEGSIYIKQDGQIYGQHYLWTSLPALSRELTLLITGDFWDTQVWFEVLNLKSSEKYVTPKRTILSRKWYVEYIRRLNDRILGTKLE